MVQTVNKDDVIGVAIYGFLLMINSNIESNSTPLGVISFRNLSDLDFDISRSLRVKCDSVIGLPR